MLKRYSSRSLALTVPVILNGEVKEIQFTKMGATSKGVAFETSDEELQLAIEKNPFFNKSFVVQFEQKEEAITQKENPNLKELLFKTDNEGKEHFTDEPYNELVSTLQTTKQIIAVGKRHGFEVKFEQ